MHEYLDKASALYYAGKPIITDREFDYLAKLYSYNKVGSAPSNRVGTVPHLNRLYSLEKFYVGDNLPLQNENLIETPKLDGAAVSILYVDGKLSTVATRGDGKVGEDITKNFIDWPGIPQEIDMLGLVQVVGEICAPKKIENSRNYASGATRQKDPQEFQKKDVHFIAYAVHYEEERPFFFTYKNDMDMLEYRFGFMTVLEPKLTGIFPTDGKVFRINDNYIYQEKGFTSKHPKGAFAVKDTDDFEIKSTTLNDVAWQVGKSGKVTPVAIFDEVVLNDAKVNKATLHNAGFIEDMDLYIGSKILVTRAGGIIPQVLGVDI